MTFLQPSILWALPLILLPVIIHMINRMRHRSQPWAAMRFLVSATRHSTSHAKLRQLLILLFRVLVVLMLIIFLSRPIAGGWMGWALSPSPDVVLILLDRSASMETLIPGTSITRREQAIKLLSETGRQFEGASRFVLIENVLRTPQEIASAAALDDLVLTAATDTAADLPAMLQSALNWLVENRTGAAEIWIASDMQRSSWRPENPRFQAIIEQFAALPSRGSGVRFRLLGLSHDAALNTSVSVHDLVRREHAGQPELQFTLDLHRNALATGPFPITLHLDDTPTHQELAMDAQFLRWRHRAEITGTKTGGWGMFELPADANRRDNVAYFVYGGPAKVRGTIFAADPAGGKFLRLAAGAVAKDSALPVQYFSPGEAAAASLDDTTLLIWQAPLPSGAVAERIRAFVEEGGMAIFFPPGQPGNERFSGVGWGEIQTAENENGFRVLRWDEEQGPLAKTDEGFSLPVAEVEFHKRQAIVGQRSLLAMFADGTPFLARQTLGRGGIYFCASLPHHEWSSLSDGPVLVPMLHRLLQSGSRRLQTVASVHCGELSAADQSRQWISLDGAEPKNIRFHAGVYRSGDRLVAVNRPPAEDEPETLEMNEAANLFAGVPFQMLQDQQRGDDKLQGEVWRMFVFALLVFLIVEGILILPSRSGAQARMRQTIEPAMQT